MRRIASIFYEICEKMEETEMDSSELKAILEWCDEMGHSEHEILELIRRIVSANPRKEKKAEKE